MRMFAPMSPDRSLLRVCPHCAHLYWFDAAERLGEVDVDDEPEESFPGAKYSYEPTFEHYVSAIPLFEHDAEKLEYLRVRVWWAGNDARRSAADGDEPSHIPLSAVERENLEKLCPRLLAGDERQRLLGAEALRELGRFEECLECLAEISSPRLMRVKALIEGLASAGNLLVAEILDGY